jgi:hypothetical protein
LPPLRHQAEAHATVLATQRTGIRCPAVEILDLRAGVKTGWR